MPTSAADYLWCSLSTVHLGVDRLASLDMWRDQIVQWKKVKFCKTFEFSEFSKLWGKGYCQPLNVQDESTWIKSHGFLSLGMFMKYYKTVFMHGVIFIPQVLILNYFHEDVFLSSFKENTWVPLPKTKLTLGNIFKIFIFM